jgi:hypothetical protein
MKDSAVNYQVPFAELLPPLTTDEFAALEGDIKTNGVRDAVIVDEAGNVLDGHNRLKVDPDAPTRVLAGLSPGEKEAFIYRANLVRRNVSPSQKAEIRGRMKLTARRLREEDAKKWTLKRVGQVLGLDESTVSLWLGSTSNSQETSKPDARVKVTPRSRPKIAERIASGENREQVGADFGISGRQAASIASQENRQKAQRESREAAAAKFRSDMQGIFPGDFRGVGDCVDDESVDLIFTDPPYDEAAVELFRDLGTFAQRVLRPGSWCLAYCGQSFLPQCLAALHESLEYGWIFCCRHSGGDLRFRKLKLQNKWKPILGFYKPDLSAWWDWFVDSATGGREKDKHEWQQSESEAAHFIAALSVADGFICDPMCGSGTTCAAAKRLGRKWIGFDINLDHVATARVRLAEIAFE